MIHPAKHAVIYCRVSTKEQVEEGNSLVTQEKICREYAAHRGYTIAEVYIEQGESAKTADRPQLQQMIKYCSDKRNRVQAVITYKIDRISRNTDDYSQIRLLMKHCGVKIESTSEQFENTPVGRFLENTLASIAEFDNSIRTERSVNGMKEAVREGRYVWLAPIGYKNVRVAGKATIAHSTLAPLLRETFTAIAQGIYPADEIRKQMFTKGLIGHRGKPLAKAYFYRLIRNKLYAGIIEKFGESHRGAFEPIISEEVFNQVQHILKYKGKRIVRYRNDREEFPLRRFVRHPLGNKLRGSWCTGKTGKKYTFYWYEGLSGYCFKTFQVETAFMRLLDKYRLSTAKDFLQQVKIEYTRSNKGKLREFELLQKQLDAIREREGQLVEKNLKGIIPDEVASRQLALLRDEQVTIQSQLLHCDQVKINIREVLAVAEKFLENPSKYWLKSDLQTRLELQEFSFPQGVTFDGKKMRTPEVSLIFKLKEEFSSCQSPVVRYRFSAIKSFMVQCERLHKILTGKTNHSTSVPG